jgi:hypothetical protein
LVKFRPISVTVFRLDSRPIRRWLVSEGIGICKVPDRTEQVVEQEAEASDRERPILRVHIANSDG